MSIRTGIARYREQSASITQSLQTLRRLNVECRWLEIQRCVAELRQTGVPVPELEQWETKAAQLFRRVGPLLVEARSHLAERCPEKAVALASQVLAHVADHAEARAILEEALRQPRRKRGLFARAVVLLIFLGLLAGAGAGACLVINTYIVVTPQVQELKPGSEESPRPRQGPGQVADPCPSQTDLGFKQACSSLPSC